MTEPIPAATHVDQDGDQWRITDHEAFLWSSHQSEWVEARSILDLTHRTNGPNALRPIRSTT